MAKTREAEEAATRAQAQANEAERALKQTFEDAMADGEIDDDEQKAIDLKKVFPSRSLSFSLAVARARALSRSLSL